MKPSLERGYSRRFVVALLLLFFLALGVRLQVALRSSVPPQSDMKEYDRIAGSALLGQKNSRNGEVLVRPPGYPLFLASVYRLFGQRYQRAYVTQALLGALMCLLAVGTCRALRQPRTIALLVGLVLAVSDSLASYTGLLLSESLFLPLAVASVWALVATEMHGSRPGLRWKLVLGGLLLGLALATRSSGIFLFAAACVWTAWRPGTVRDRAFALALMASSCALAVLAVSTLGWWVWGEWVVSDPHTGRNLWMGNNPSATGTYFNPPGIEPGGVPEVLEFILHEPLHFLRLSVRRFVLLWTWQANDLAIFSRGPWPRPWGAWLDRWLFALAGGLAVVASVHLHRVRAVRLPILALGFASVMLSFTFVLPRFRIGLLPFLWILAGCGLTVLEESFHRNHWAGMIRSGALGFLVGGSLLFLTIESSPWGPRVLLSGNLDKGPRNPNVRILLDPAGGPDPAPEMHPTGHGTLATELLDGLRTGTADPTWECLLWQSPRPYIGFRGRVLIDLGELSLVERVQAYTVSPYGNHRIDQMDVSLSEDGAFFLPAGTIINDRPQARADAFPMQVRIKGRPARYVELVLRQHNGSGTVMSLCEVYVYGRKLTRNLKDPNRR